MSADVLSGVPDVDGDLNVSPVAHFGVLDVAVISCVCRRLIPLHSQFLCEEPSLEISNGVYSGVLDVDGDLNVLFVVQVEVPDVDGGLNVSPVFHFGVLDVAVTSYVCRRPIPLCSQFLHEDQGLKILAGVLSGVPDVEGGLNASPVVHFGIPDVSVILGVCHKLIPLHSLFLCVDQGLKTSDGVLDVDGGLNV